MPKTANINVRIDPDVKKEAENVFSSFGITLSDAINIFLRKSIMSGGLPFDIRENAASAAKVRNRKQKPAVHAIPCDANLQGL